MSLLLSKLSWYYSESGSNDSPQSAAQALAWQDAYLRLIPSLQETNKSKGIIHFYQHLFPTVILGPKDSRLPALSEGVEYLIRQGYAPHLRAHGGLAVVADPGILNISYIIDMNQDFLSIDQAYRVMVEWVKEALLTNFNLSIEAYEIPNSYCPGTYDLVHQGLKIGGIAQRRFKSGVATAAYLSITGPQDKRALLIHRFYQQSQANDDYPLVSPEVMASLDQWIPTIQIQDIKDALIKTIGHEKMIGELPFKDNPTYQTMYAKALERNQTLFS